MENGKSFVLMDFLRWKMRKWFIKSSLRYQQISCPELIFLGYLNYNLPSHRSISAQFDAKNNRNIVNDDNKSAIFVCVLLHSRDDALK